MTAPTPTTPQRPREVTLAGTQAVTGSLIALVVLVNGMQQLYSSEVDDALREVVASDEAKTLGLTLDSARTALRYSIMVLAVLSAASFVLGIFTLRRHRAARVALTVVGGVVALMCLAGGPIGWAVTAYVGVSVSMLWTRSARAWFGDAASSSGNPPGPPRLPGSRPPPPPPPAARGPSRLTPRFVPRSRSRCRLVSLA